MKSEKQYRLNLLLRYLYHKAETVYLLNEPDKLLVVTDDQLDFMCEAVKEKLERDYEDA
jgi:hypothetical protein